MPENPQPTCLHAKVRNSPKGPGIITGWTYVGYPEVDGVAVAWAELETGEIINAEARDEWLMQKLTFLSTEVSRKDWLEYCGRVERELEWHRIQIASWQRHAWTMFAAGAAAGALLTSAIRMWL